MRLNRQTREQIAATCQGKTHDELVDIICHQAAVDRLLTATEIAAASKVNKRDVLRDINAGKFVDPVLGPGFFTRGENSKKVTAAAFNSWLRSFFVPVTINREREA